MDFVRPVFKITKIEYI